MRKLLFVIPLLFAASLRADTVYTYTGNILNDSGSIWYGSLIPLYSSGHLGPCNCALDGSFTVAAPIIVTPGEPGESIFGFLPITPESYSFTDGTDTLNQTNSTIALSLNTFDYPAFQGPSVTLWNLEIFGNDGTTFYSEWNTSESYSGDEISGPDAEALGYEFLYLQYDPGTWTVSTPEPGTAALLLAGIGLLGLLTLRRYAENRRSGKMAGANFLG